MLKILKLFSGVIIIFSLSTQVAVAHKYPAQVGEKLGYGIANVVTGVAEIPKTMIVTGREKGAAYGVTAGFFTGIIHMVGRMFTGALDIATFMVPTTTIPQPPVIWDDFDKETEYGPWKMR
ncbi:exosortase system-associated protein, TIGR04073 family [Nitrosomonas aestuarii]|uniref:exosortase system-associated protein, TIGR04073 family n=1 Tax=Nitrosomonas aestuarii TaxID=52441 RepID=UPI000D30B3B9|nr:exosortase system-associated protein, TIGR04073 family [Nitrosomonas aestuarii]PTN11571.1 putative exosortase-associated protein (TIGR04073 family) [Nitrosomonas aestuarii]